MTIIGRIVDVKEFEHLDEGATLEDTLRSIQADSLADKVSSFLVSHFYQV